MAAKSVALEVLSVSAASERLPIRRERAVTWLRQQIDAGRLTVAQIDGSAPLVLWNDVVALLFQRQSAAAEAAAPQPEPARASARLRSPPPREYDL